MALFLGIDPGIETTGFALVERSDSGKHTLVQCGVIRTPAGEDLSARLTTLHDDLYGFLEQNPTIVEAGVEELFFARNTTSALVVGQARGVILYTIEQFQIPVRHLTPNQVKQGMTGMGNADKKHMQRMVMMEFGLTTPPEPDDAADAAAIALTCATRYYSPTD